MLEIAATDEDLLLLLCFTVMVDMPFSLLEILKGIMKKVSYIQIHVMKSL